MSQSLIASIEDLTEDRPVYTIAPGIFKIEKKNLSEKSKFLVDSFFIGICGIADTVAEVEKPMTVAPDQHPVKCRKFKFDVLVYLYIDSW